MKKVSNLSLSDRILSYLKRGIALVSAAATIVSASKTSAKAEGNSNLPNQTNITQETNTPIPSMEDVITSSTTNIQEETIMDTEQHYEAHVYTDSIFEKYNLMNPQISNKNAKAIYLMNWPNVSKKLTNELIASGKLKPVDTTLNGRIYYDENFQDPFETFTDLYIKIKETALKKNKNITAEELNALLPNIAIACGVKNQEIIEKCELIKSWFADILINGSKCNGYNSIMEFIMGMSLNEYSKKSIRYARDSIRNNAFNEQFSGDYGYTYWLLIAPYIGKLNNMIFPELKRDKRFEKYFKYVNSSYISRGEVNSDEKGRRRKVNQSDPFEVNYIYYYFVEQSINHLVYEYLLTNTFQEGSKNYYLWINGGIENFDETLYTIPKEITKK